MKTNNFNKLLLVEGKNDLHVILSLCEKFEIVQNFEIKDTNGYDNLIKGLPIRIKNKKESTIGIIIDADFELGKRWESISSILRASGYEIPKNIPTNGLIIGNESQVIIGIWMMPNNKFEGMLEDFIAFLVPENDETMPYVDNLMTTIETKNLNKYSLPNNKSKARIHTWLGLQESPGSPLGQAITKKYLTTENEVCGLFINWLKVLFA